MSRQASFDDVIDAHGPALWRLTAGYARQQADRNDLYQEILLAVWRALPSFRGDASLRTFVLRIGHNRGLTFRARNGLRTGREQEIPLDLRDERPLPDALAEDSADRARLVAAIASLPASLAQTVMLHLEGLSYAELADVLGITENNVGVRLNRARAALSRLLTGSIAR